LNEVVLDASALLALMRHEPGAATVAGHLGHSAISTANLAEAYGRLLREISSPDPDDVRRDIEMLKLTVHPFDVEQAFFAGLLEPATRKLGLSLRDRACLALAKKLQARVLTTDRMWAKLDLGIRIEVIR
jgi:ribonuclease VapC